MQITAADSSYPRMAGLEQSIVGLEATLESSKGQASMSITDVKTAVLDLMLALKHQIAINEILALRIQELEKKR